MKNYIFSILSLVCCLSSQAQTMNQNELADRALLKELVDTYAIVADKKDAHTLAQLFTANATSETFVDGKSVSKMTGGKQLEDGFGAFLSNFQTVYHFNGQQKVTLNGNKATGTLYCLVTLIGSENGKKMKTTIGVIYEDEFVKENGHWLIANRKGNFDWQEKRELGQ